MDHAELTSSGGELGDPAALAAAVADLRAKEAIRNLVALYSIARDDDDLGALVPLFAPDGSFTIGGVTAGGHAALREFYTGTMSRYRTSLHTTHTALLSVTGSTATGLVTGHAELAYAGTLMMAAYRYDDAYTVTAGRWTFASRVLRFMYTVPFDEMGTSFGDGRRIRWPGTEPVAAEFPEGNGTYDEFRRSVASPA